LGLGARLKKALGDQKIYRIIYVFVQVCPSCNFFFRICIAYFAYSYSRKANPRPTLVAPHRLLNIRVPKRNEMPGTRSKQRGAPSTNVGTPVEEQRSDQATPKTPGALLGEKRLVAAAESNHMQRARARPDSGSNIGPESDSDASTPEVSHLREVTGGSSPFFLASAEEGLERELRAQKEGQASTYGSAHELVKLRCKECNLNR
jgi:hypothetical protein